MFNRFWPVGTSGPVCPSVPGCCTLLSPHMVMECLLVQMFGWRTFSAVPLDLKNQTKTRSFSNNNASWNVLFIHITLLKSTSLFSYIYSDYCNHFILPCILSPPSLEGRFITSMSGMVKYLIEGKLRSLNLGLGTQILSSIIFNALKFSFQLNLLCSDEEKVIT